MRPLHALVLVGAVPVLVVAGCQLVTGVDTIEYATGTGGASSGVTGVSAQSSTGATMSSTAESSSSSSMGTGGGCGDGTCDLAKENACNCRDDCPNPPPKADNGCCEVTELAAADCVFPCDHDKVCDVGESCDHCDDCGVDSHGIHPPQCAPSCTDQGQCGGAVLKCCECPDVGGVCTEFMFCQNIPQAFGCGPV